MIVTPDVENLYVFWVFSRRTHWEVKKTRYVCVFSIFIPYKQFYYSIGRLPVIYLRLRQPNKFHDTYVSSCKIKT